jgi:hypothetical protein
LIREHLLKRWLSTVNLLVLTSLDQLIFKLKILFTFVTKQVTLMRRSTVLSLPLQLVFPDLIIKMEGATVAKRMSEKLNGKQKDPRFVTPALPNLK